MLTSLQYKCVNKQTRWVRVQRVFKVQNFRIRTSEKSTDSDSNVRKTLIFCSRFNPVQQCNALYIEGWGISRPFLEADWGRRWKGHLFVALHLWPRALKDFSLNIKIVYKYFTKVPPYSFFVLQYKNCFWHIPLNIQPSSKKRSRILTLHSGLKDIYFCCKIVERCEKVFL
jgi:hypothetical protein